MQKNNIITLLGKAAAVVTVVSMFAVVSPALAVDATDISDTLDRQAVGQVASHHLVATVASARQNQTITFSYNAAGFTFGATAGATTCTWGGDTCAASITGGNDLLVTCSDAGDCASGTLDVNQFAYVNPSAGSHIVTIAGTAGVTGSFAIATNDSDQVTVSATVDPTITFDLDTAETDTHTDAAYSVTLDTLIPGTPKSSGNTSNVEYIWTDLTTNANSGAVVTVKNANGANGLVSTSTAGDDIDSADGTMAGATENYGLCVENDIYPPTDTLGNYDAVAPFDDAGCGEDDTNNVVGGLTGLAQTILDTDGEGILAARAAISVNANANVLTDPHTDYADTLTFVATGTF